MALQYTYAELKKMRRDALRGVRREQRELDTRLERLERRIFKMMDRKTIITAQAAQTLVPLYNDFRKHIITVENALADFISLIEI